MSQENVEIMHRSIDAWNRGNRAAALAAYAPEVEWHTSGEFVDRRVYRGHTGLKRLWAELEQDLEELSILVGVGRACVKRLISAQRIERGHALAR